MPAGPAPAPAPARDTPAPHLSALRALLARIEAEIARRLAGGGRR
ncbi:MAG TPA: hypothetical protein PKE47_01940 [Verrucomicrobiota bacterium]|nr:hypothetical protein [Verrucomicrobiota bacterium]